VKKYPLREDKASIKPKGCEVHCDSTGSSLNDLIREIGAFIERFFLDRIAQSPRPLRRSLRPRPTFILVSMSCAPQIGSWEFGGVF